MNMSLNLQKLISVIVLSFITIGACFASLSLFSSQSLRLDESQSLWQISYNTENLIKVVSTDVHVPLYHITLQAWNQLFKDSVYYDRILSLVFLLLSIFALYLLYQEAYTDRISALFSSFLLAFSAYFQWYGSELRMYTLLVFITILNQYFFLKILKNYSTYNWLGYLFISILGLYTHYFFITILFTELIFWIFNRPNYKNFYWSIAFTYFTLALTFLPWLFLVHLQNSSSSQPFLSKPSSIDVFNIFSQLLFGYQNNTINSIIVASWPLIIAIIFLNIRKSISIDSKTVFFSFSAIVPVVLAFLVSQFIKPAFLSRYLILILPSLIILITNLISKVKPIYLNILLKIVVACTVIASLLTQANSSQTPVKEDFEDAAYYVSQKSDFKDVVALSAPFITYPFEYYYTGSASLTTIPSWNRFKDVSIPTYSKNNMVKQVDNFKTRYRTVWLVISFDQGYNSDIKSYFEDNFNLIETKEFSPDLKVYHFKLRYDY